MVDRGNRPRSRRSRRAALLLVAAAALLLVCLSGGSLPQTAPSPGPPPGSGSASGGASAADRQHRLRHMVHEETDSDEDALFNAHADASAKSHGLPLRERFRRLLHGGMREEYYGYGPSLPRVAVVIMGEPSTVVGAVESVLRHTDRNRLLVVVAVMDGHGGDGEEDGGGGDLDLSAALADAEGEMLGMGAKGKGRAAAGRTKPQTQTHGSQKVYAMYNPEAEGVSASRADAVAFVNILVRKHEEAGLKHPEEEILLMFLRSEARIEDSGWLPSVSGALLGGDGKGAVISDGNSGKTAAASAVSLRVDGPTAMEGDVTTLTPSFHIKTSRAEQQQRGAATSSTTSYYPTPLVGGLATAMTLATYNSLPHPDPVLTTAAAADVELSLALWLCTDHPGAVVPSAGTASVQTARGTPSLHDHDISDDEATRLIAAWMPEEEGLRERAYAARAGRAALGDAKRRHNDPNPRRDAATAALRTSANEAMRSGSLPTPGEGGLCRPYSYFDSIVLQGERKDKDGRDELGIHGESESVRAGDDVHGGTGGDGHLLPKNPLDPSRLAMIKKTKPISIEYIDATGGHKEHPHMGAKDENGQWGYVHDETFLRRDPPAFDLPEKEQACAKRDAEYKMLTKKVFVDLEGEAKAEREAKETGRDRPKILCAIFTASKYHDKLEAIRNTWGPKCDGIIFASDVTDRSIGTVNIPHEGIEEYNNIWQKVRSMWSYVYDNYYDKYDYFHSGGDDVYLLVENMRQYLESEEIRLASNGGVYLPADNEEYQTPLFLGRRFKNGGDEKQIFNSGGSGYTMNKVRACGIFSFLLRICAQVSYIQCLVSFFCALSLSRSLQASLKALVVDSMPNCMPHKHDFSEDVLVARCLRKLGILAYDTKDEAGGERYMPFTPGHHLTYKPPKNVKDDWYSNYSIDCKWGLDHCAARAIAFHYVKGEVAYLFVLWLIFFIGYSKTTDSSTLPLFA